MGRTWLNPVWLVLGLALSSAWLAADPPLKPTQSGRNYHLFYPPEERDGGITSTAVQSSARDDLWFIGAHGNQGSIFGPDDKPMSIDALADYLVAQPGFEKVKMLYLNVCLAGHCQLGGNNAEKLLAAIKKRAPNQKVAILAPAGVIELGVRSYDDFPDRTTVQVISEASLLAQRRERESGSGKRVLLHVVNDRNAFTLTEWDGTGAKSRPMAGSTVASQFNWIYYGPTRNKLAPPDIRAACDAKFKSIFGG